MKRSTSTMLAGAALAGLLTGSVSAASTATNPTGRVSAGKATTFADAGDKHDCAGKNDCKGKGGCKTGDNGCKGKNSCKGKGGCSTEKKGHKKDA